MKHYVLAFAQMIPPDSTNNIVLIERKKDDWQHGKLNLPGGSVNEGELPEVAACRELREETGLIASVADTQVLGALVGDRWRADVCYCPYRRLHNGSVQVPQTLTEEGDIISMPWRDAMVDERLPRELKIIIPFCQSRLIGWSVFPVSVMRWEVML